MIDKKGILVTGSHRSGSTWVGKMLALSPSVGYINEPFNFKDRQDHPGICSAKFDYWFTYIATEDESIFYDKIKDTIGFSYKLKEELNAIKSTRDALIMLRDYLNYSKYRLYNVRPLVKDPIALFSAEWLASKFDMDVLVLIRHPAAFVSSLKTKNWTFPFSHFLDQELLMRDHLHPFDSEIKEYVRKEYDIIDQGILLWKITHSIISKYQNKYKDWIFVKHEDISLEPVVLFENIFKKLDLEFSYNILKRIQKYTSDQNPTESHKNNIIWSKRDSIKRDSVSNIKNWKNRLTVSEIEKIRRKVEDISNLFYSDDDWK